MKNHRSLLPSANPLFLQKVFDSLDVIVCVVDTEGRFVHLNKATHKIWGYHPDELIGRHCYDFMVPQDQIESLTAVANVQASPTPLAAIENRYYHKNGSTVTMLWEGGGFDPDTHLIYSTGRDVSAQRRLEALEQIHRAELQFAKTELEQLVDRITDGFLGLDNEARVIYWNKAAERISRLPQQAMVGHSLWEVLPEPTRSLARHKLAEIKTTSGPLHVEYFAERIQRWIEVHAYISETGVSVFFRDISERKSLADQLTQEREQRHREKEKAQKQITAAVIKAAEKERAHLGRELHDNINQVLTTVKLYTELCTAKKVDSNVVLPKCTQLLNETINEIRKMSKSLVASSLHSIGIEEAFKDLVDSVRMTQTIDLEMDFTALCCNTIEEDLQLATYRIAQEHLTNILKHADASHVTISLSCTTCTLLMVIEDDGIGFDLTQKGSGIGIANMKSRVSLFDGVFSLRGEKGKGSKLTVSFPVTFAAGKCTPGEKRTFSK